jgi:hypothetical protein
VITHRLSSRVRSSDFNPAGPGKRRPRLTLLREFDLSVDGVRASVPMATQRVVAFLALNDRAVLRTHVAASLWLNATDARAQASLRSALWRLGRGNQAIVHVANGTRQLDSSVATDLYLRRRLLGPEGLLWMINTSRFASRDIEQRGGASSPKSRSEPR